MTDIRVPINADGRPTMVFRNAEESGWMWVEDWDLWKRYMSGDHDDRERGRRHKPAMNAYAAALITGSIPYEAEHIKSEVYQDARREWKRKHGIGHVIDQFVRHLEFQHAIGKIALYFIPYVGPLASQLAQGFDPMVEAAEKKAISDHEAENVSDRFRQEYYEAMDAWIRDDNADLPGPFLAYHAEVVAPAALDVKEQMMSGVLETASGLYPLNRTGLELWAAQNEDYSMPVIGGGYTLVKREFSTNWRALALGALFASIAAFGLHAVMAEAS